MPAARAQLRLTKGWLSAAEPRVGARPCSEDFQAGPESKARQHTHARPKRLRLSNDLSFTLLFILSQTLFCSLPSDSVTKKVCSNWADLQRLWSCGEPFRYRSFRFPRLLPSRVTAVQLSGQVLLRRERERDPAARPFPVTAVTPKVQHGLDGEDLTANPNVPGNHPDWPSRLGRGRAS